MRVTQVHIDKRLHNDETPPNPGRGGEGAGEVTFCSQQQLLSSWKLPTPSRLLEPELGHHHANVRPPAPNRSFGRGGLHSRMGKNMQTELANMEELEQIGWNE